MSERVDSSGTAVGYVPLPEGLAEMAPGPALAGLLASLDRGAYNGFQLVEIVTARQRQVCFEQAQLLADLHELAYSSRGRFDAPPSRETLRDPHAEEEVSFALKWTMAAASDQLSVAWATIDCHPTVHAAMVAGRIDVAKARMIVDEVDLASTEQAAAIIAQILPDADLYTVPSLRHRIRRLLLAIDPELVHKRYVRDVAQRNVSVKEYRNGTASITGRFLPIDKVARAMDYLSAVATATTRAGDPAGGRFDDRDQRSTAQIRADVFLDLLAGADPTIPAADGGAGAVQPGPRKGAVNLTVELATLLCLNDHPGELDGFGPIVADIARQVADDLRQVTTWRFVLTDGGKVIHQGRLHYRPTAAEKSFVTTRDRYCRAPGCRRPARQCDIDHVTAWDEHGTTHEDNLCVLCKLCRRRHKRHYAEQRIMPRSVVKWLRCRASVVGSAA